MERPPYSVVLPGQCYLNRLLVVLVEGPKSEFPREAWVPSTQLALTVETR